MRMTFTRSPHYDCFLDPSDPYLVRDDLADAPCMVDGEVLAFPTRAKAVATLDLLNRSGGPNARDGTGATRGSLQ